MKMLPALLLLAACASAPEYADDPRARRDAYECEREAAVAHSADQRRGLMRDCMALRGYDRAR